MSEWYLKNPAGASSGPHPTQAIIQWISAGQVGADHTVCPTGGSQWVPLTEVPMFLGSLVSRRGPSMSTPPSSAQAPPQPSRPPQPSPQSAPWGRPRATPGRRRRGARGAPWRSPR